MKTPLEVFHHAISIRYPDISAKANKEYERLWGELPEDELTSYSWFEALAKALNREMCRNTPASEYGQLLACISAEFRTGTDEVRKCIDVAFVENLFWQVAPNKALAY